MNELLHYHTIGKPSLAEFKDRGSRFIAYAYPIETTDNFKLRLAELKREHPKAAHYCFAYRIGTDGNSFRVSDDGEPAGTAGKPILGQIDSRQITNAALVVIRYFGGTLLGVPGLINAYKSAASMALQLTPIIQKHITSKYKLTFDYTRMNEVMMILKQTECNVLQSETLLFCEMSVAIAKARIEEVLGKFKELHAVDIVLMN